MIKKESHYGTFKKPSPQEEQSDLSIRMIQITFIRSKKENN